MKAGWCAMQSVESSPGCARSGQARSASLKLSSGLCTCWMDWRRHGRCAKHTWRGCGRPASGLQHWVARLGTTWLLEANQINAITPDARRYTAHSEIRGLLTTGMIAVAPVRAQCPAMNRIPSAQQVMVHCCDQPVFYLCQETNCILMCCINITAYHR